MRQDVVDFVRAWSKKRPLTQAEILGRLGVSSGKYHDWVQRYELENGHNAQLPKEFWLQKAEKKAILSYHAQHPDEGYRRLAYMMLDENIAAVSPSSVYRTLKSAGKLKKWAKKPSKKGKGFKQPQKPHAHWHIDISYINLAGTFYSLCAVLDGYSRYIVHWEMQEQMTETDVEMILLRAKERFPGERPRIISDNGPQFIARAFKEFIRFNGMTHVRTSPYYPQSNGKIERWHKSLKQECIRSKTPPDLADARRIVADYIRHYNERRLHSAIGYITPQDKLNGREKSIFAERKQKLHKTRKRRKIAAKLNVASHQNSLRHLVCAVEVVSYFLCPKFNFHLRQNNPARAVSCADCIVGCTSNIAVAVKSAAIAPCPGTGVGISEKQPFFIPKFPGLYSSQSYYPKGDIEVFIGEVLQKTDAFTIWRPKGYYWRYYSL